VSKAELGKASESRAGNGSADFAPVAVQVNKRPDGSAIYRSTLRLEAGPPTVGAMLDDAAREAPDRIFVAERAGSGWRGLSHAEFHRTMRRIAAGLLELGCGPDAPLAILSDNSLDVALTGMAAHYVGVPVVPISPSYSKLSQDFEKLRSILAQTEPAAVYAADAPTYGRALRAAVRSGARIVVSDPRDGEAAWIPFARLSGHAGDEGRVEAAKSRVGADSIGRIMFTSGSTALPKGVVTTQRMLSAHQQTIAQTWRFLARRPPVIVDWLPWSHAFGANFNFLLALRHKGTIHVDDGRPAPGLIEKTVANLKSASPTIYFNVPRGYQVLLPHLEKDEDFARAFFRDLDAIFYAGADMPKPLWERYERLAERFAAKPPLFLTSWGLTESTAAATIVHFPARRAGNIGVPVPGTDIKFVPVGDKLEIRMRGPGITPGYWKRPDLTAAAFDEEGFFRTGDAGRPVDSDDPAAGFAFDGRIGENFKLSTGRWVYVGELRVKAVAAGAPVVEDVVVAGHDRDEATFLIFPSLQGCRALAPELARAGLPEIAVHPAVRARVADMMKKLLDEKEGAARVRRAIVLTAPPSVDANEITDKGYLNQRQVLARRADAVEALYAPARRPEIVEV